MSCRNVAVKEVTVKTAQKTRENETGSRGQPALAICMIRKLPKTFFILALPFLALPCFGVAKIIRTMP